MPDRSFSLVISNCAKEDFPAVKAHIAELSLDDNDLEPEQFLIAKTGEEIVGFGRLRTYPDSCELCSLGVVEKFRRQGVGSELSRALIQKSDRPLYLVTIIPEFFKKLGFNVIREFPSEIKVKLNYCSSALPVPETYMVMRHF